MNAASMYFVRRITNDANGPGRAIVPMFCMLILLVMSGFVGNAAGQIRVLIQTDAGNMTAMLDSARAPVTVRNFLAYVDSSYYDDGVFFRTVRAGNQPDNKVKIDVIQGRANEAHAAAFSPIKLERTPDTGLRHRNGTISMARSGPDTATSHFFICIGDQPELDFGGARNPDGQGFAAFGSIIDGMATVESIHERPAEQQRLTPPVQILSIRRLN